MAAECLQRTHSTRMEYNAGKRYWLACNTAYNQLSQTTAADWMSVTAKNAKINHSMAANYTVGHNKTHQNVFRHNFRKIRRIWNKFGRLLLK